MTTIMISKLAIRAQEQLVVWFVAEPFWNIPEPGFVLQVSRNCSRSYHIEEHADLSIVNTVLCVGN